MKGVENLRQAVSILHRRYLAGDPHRVGRVERERTNAEVAQLIYDRRLAAGLTQKQLAKLVGTTQSVISRLEDADYEGHSLTMLQRIASARRAHHHRNGATRRGGTAPSLIASPPR